MFKSLAKTKDLRNLQLAATQMNVQRGEVAFESCLGRQVNPMVESGMNLVNTWDSLKVDASFDPNESDPDRPRAIERKKAHRSLLPTGRVGTSP